MKILWCCYHFFCLHFEWSFKGILHPKMTILSWLTHPRVDASLYEFLSSDEHKRRYFKEWLEPNSCLAPLTSIVEKKYYGSQWCQKFQSFINTIPFVFNRSKKLIQGCNNLRMSQSWQNCHFWVEYPFKHESSLDK